MTLREDTILFVQIKQSEQSRFVEKKNSIPDEKQAIPLPDSVAVSERFMLKSHCKNVFSFPYCGSRAFLQKALLPMR